jgi:DNA-binding transcriptional ArsR family regulator
MTDCIPPISAAQAAPDEPSGRSPEIDKFVDRFLSLMCDHSRRHILELLSQPYEESHIPFERRSTDIAKKLGLSPTTTSEHLHRLLEAKLLTSRREGNIVYYRLANQLLVQTFIDLVHALQKEYSQGEDKNVG